jgi:hypothetical protein
VVFKEGNDIPEFILDKGEDNMGTVPILSSNNPEKKEPNRGRIPTSPLVNGGRVPPLSVFLN